MLAAILVEQKQPLVIDEISLPPDLQYGQVLVRVKYSGICGSQLGEIDGVKGPDRFLPHLLGHEGGAVVEDIGPGVTKVKPGDHVVLHWRKATGIESPTPLYRWGRNTVNAGWVTTFNNQAVVSENRLTPISKDISLEAAALYGCAITTGYGAVFNDGMLKAGQSIAIFGVGGIGLSEVLSARLGSANPIIAIDIHQHKLDKAEHFGATHTINSATENVREKLLDIIPDGPDIVIENTGINAVREQAYSLAAKTSRVVLVGVPKSPSDKMQIDSLQLHFTKVLTGCHGGDIEPNYHIPRLLNLQQQGYFSTDGMISHRFDLDRINEAIEKMRSGESIRCSIEMGEK